MSGFYRMQRGWMEHPVFAPGPLSEREAWAWMIERAAWKAMKARADGKVISLRRGQFVGSCRFLAEQWGWSKSSVARFLKRLSDEGMIETKGGTDSETATNVVSICNYNKYQAEPGTIGTGNGTAAGRKRDRSGTNRKKGKEVNIPPLSPHGGVISPERVKEIIGESVRWENTPDGMRRVKVA